MHFLMIVEHILLGLMVDDDDDDVVVVDDETPVDVVV